MRRLIGVTSAVALLCAITFCFSTEVLAENPLGVPDSEYNALVALYNATDGPNWTNNTNWLTANIPWYGVTVEDGHVTNVSLWENNLVGSIPSEIGNLTNLRYLYLDHNQLNGTIPVEIGNLTNLEGFSLFVNQLSGSIPPQIGNLTNLQGLSLEYNQLSGPIPAEISNLTNLDGLCLGHNQLNGQIPPQIGNLTNLRLLDLCQNQLSGTIPPEIGNIVTLRSLKLGDNQLTGNIPSEIGNLTNLESLWLYVNQLSGQIPPEIGNLANLEWLWLSSNTLSGPIPIEIGYLTNLRNLDLSSNPLSGQIPPEIGNLTNLRHLSLSHNQLNGPIPSEIGNLTHVIWLNLSGNQLSGSIPPEIGNLANLTYLYLWFNQLSGQIPSEIGNLTNLQRIDMNLNQLSGTIPPEIGNLTNLRSMNLFRNQLSGHIPSEIGNLVNLEDYLSLSYNQLSGSIPPEIGNLVNLRHLSLYGNQLAGEVPLSLANLMDLDWLGIDYNALSCSDPAVLTYLAQKQSDWQSTQTVPPTNVGVYNPGTGTAAVYWTPIEFSGAGGYYEVGYSATSGGPYTFDPANRTANKQSSSLGVTGLDPGQPAYFVVRTVSLSHFYNQSTLTSANSAEATVASNPFGIPTSEYDALVALYNATDGPNWTNNTNWLTANTPWYGVTIELGHVTGVDLYHNNLVGSIPTEIGNLGNLEWLYLYINQLSGQIPSEIGNLTNLRSLYLWTNQLSGSIPSEIGNLTNLRYLYLDHNQLNGQIPPEIGNLVNLQGLALSENQLSGPIPSQIWNLTSLDWLILEQNQLSGTIPPEMGNLTNLQRLDMSGNQFSGTIPPEIGNLTNLQSVDLTGNQLTGEVPSSLVNMANLWGLYIGFNALSCSDPAVLSFLAEKQWYWQYSQTVPPTNVSARLVSNGLIMVSWEPLQSWLDGYYEVGYSVTPGGPYAFYPANRTEYLWEDTIWIDGHDPNQPVYLVVRTVTPAHLYNQSTLTSLNSVEVTPIAVIHGSKLAADGVEVFFEDVIVTASFSGCCYIGNEARSWGLLVRGPDEGDGDWPDPGARAWVIGTMRTNDDGERYLEVIDGDIIGTGSIAPLGINNRNLGGGNFNYNAGTGAGQRGVTGGAGLNNIGLLVRTTGACTYVDEHTFTINDGSGVPIICETPPTILASPAWDYVAVTGISSIRESDGTYERLLRVTAIDPIVSRPPEGVTGRWEMTNTSGLLTGVFGMLLVQQENAVSGRLIGREIENGQMNGQIFTYTCLAEEQDQTIIDAVLSLNGNTLSGTWDISGEGLYQVTFQKVSNDPVSPYVGRPKVVSASCDGQSIHVTWDRPVLGWDYDVLNEYGQSIAQEEWNEGLASYDPETHTFHIMLDLLTPFVPGTSYTIYLDVQKEGDGPDWQDLYGVPAWESQWDAYSFEYIAPSP